MNPATNMTGGWVGCMCSCCRDGDRTHCGSDACAGPSPVYTETRVLHDQVLEEDEVDAPASPKPTPIWEKQRQRDRRRAGRQREREPGQGRGR